MTDIIGFFIVYEYKYFFFFPADTTPPSLTCPATVIAMVELGVASTVVTFGSPVVTDNSGTASLVSVTPASGTFFQVGSTTVTFRYRDPSGNEASCSFLVVVNTGKI